MDVRELVESLDISEIEYAKWLHYCCISDGMIEFFSNLPDLNDCEIDATLRQFGPIAHHLESPWLDLILSATPEEERIDHDFDLSDSGPWLPPATTAHCFAMEIIIGLWQGLVQELPQREGGILYNRSECRRLAQRLSIEQSQLLSAAQNKMLSSDISVNSRMHGVQYATSADFDAYLALALPAWRSLRDRFDQLAKQGPEMFVTVSTRAPDHEENRELSKSVCEWSLDCCVNQYFLDIDVGVIFGVQENGERELTRTHYFRGKLSSYYSDEANKFERSFANFSTLAQEARDLLFVLPKSIAGRLWSRGIISLPSHQSAYWLEAVFRLSAFVPGGLAQKPARCWKWPGDGSDWREYEQHFDPEILRITLQFATSASGYGLDHWFADLQNFLAMSVFAADWIIRELLALQQSGESILETQPVISQVPPLFSQQSVAVLRRTILLDGQKQSDSFGVEGEMRIRVGIFCSRVAIRSHRPPDAFCGFSNPLPPRLGRPSG